MAWTSPKTWTADELLTASDLNQYISDNLSALYALTQGGGRKNLLDNGMMQIHQRGTPASGITAGGYYTADRWKTLVGTLGTWTQSVEADGPSGSGFTKSLKMLCSTADASPSAGDYAILYQAIEGQNLQSVKKGTASAQQLTLSFWTKSNKTGTYVVRLNDVVNARVCSTTYTISASATWEQKTITIPADLTGTLANSNAAALRAEFFLAAGTDYTSGTLATTWQTDTGTNAAVGQTNLAASTNNYWQITGVQLEVGATATGFEHKDYGTELAECQRYFQRFGFSTNERIGTCFVSATTVAYAMLVHKVRMRAIPTSHTRVGTVQLVMPGIIANSVTASAMDTPGYDTSELGLTISADATNFVIGRVCHASVADASSYIGISADL